MFHMLRRSKLYIYVFSANIISLLAGAFLSFALPFVLNIQDYGYYKQFTLLLSYVGLMHFGFNDGIYLQYGGYHYDDLPKDKFKAYFKYLLFQQLVCSLFFFSVSLLFFSDKKLIIAGFLIVNMLIINLMRFFSFISQITERLAVYSFVYAIEKCALLIPVLGLFLLSQSNYVILIISQTLIYFLILVFFLYKFRDLVRKTLKKKDTLTNDVHKSFILFRIVKSLYQLFKLNQEIKNLLKRGFSLMLGNFILIMIFNIDRVVIALFLPIENFSIYSFTVNLLSIILVFASTLSMIIYPKLKRKERAEYKKFYIQGANRMTFLAVLALGVYFPLAYLIQTFLPGYERASLLLLILLPGVALRLDIDIVMNNLFKSMHKEKLYFFISVVTLLISLVMNLLFIAICQNMVSVALSTTISFAFWYVLSDLFLSRMFRTFNFKKYLFLICAFTCFYLVHQLDILNGAMVYYGGIMTLIALYFLYRLIRKLLSIRLFVFKQDQSEAN